jgi:hypothetical protein
LMSLRLVSPGGTADPGSLEQFSTVIPEPRSGARDP